MNDSEAKVLVSANNRREATVRFWTAAIAGAALMGGAGLFAALKPAPINRVENVVRVDTVAVTNTIEHTDTVYLATDAEGNTRTIRQGDRPLTICRLGDGTLLMQPRTFHRTYARHGVQWTWLLAAAQYEEREQRHVGIGGSYGDEAKAATMILSGPVECRTQF